MHTLLDPPLDINTCWHRRRKSLWKLSKFHEYKRDADRRKGIRGTIAYTHTKTKGKKKKVIMDILFLCVCDCRCWSDSSSRIENKGRGKQTHTKKEEKRNSAAVAAQQPSSLSSRLSMKHNPSLIASRLSSLRYSLRLMHREKAVPSYVTLLLPSTLFTRPLCSIAISVFLFVDIIILLWLLLFLFRSSDDQQQSLKKSCLYNKRCGSVSSLICSSRRHPTPPNSRRPNNHRKRRKGENEKTLRLDLIHIITAREYINISMEL